MVKLLQRSLRAMMSKKTKESPATETSAEPTSETSASVTEKESLETTTTTTTSKAHYFVESQNTDFGYNDEDDEANILGGTQEADEADQGQTTTPAGNAENTGTTGSQAQKPQKRTRMRHHTLRLGINAVFFNHNGLGQPPLVLTPEAQERWMSSEKELRMFKCGKIHAPGRGQHGCRAARSEVGPAPVELAWHTPASAVEIGEADFVSGFDFENAVSDWLETYLSLNHAFQKASTTDYQYKVHNYMFGAQLDKGGNGMHYQLMTKVRTDWTADDAKAWTDRLENDFKQHFLGMDMTDMPQTSSRCTMAKEKHQDQHAGYACHSHKNPWAVRQRGTFTSKTPEEYFQLFLKWQDHEHRKLHINNVEKDVENLRSGGGEHVVPDELDLAARDIEDLIAGGIVTRTKDGVNLSHCELARALYHHKKRAGVTFPKMTRTKKEVVICMASARTKFEFPPLF